MLIMKLLTESLSGCIKDMTIFLKTCFLMGFFQCVGEKNRSNMKAKSFKIT